MFRAVLICGLLVLCEGGKFMVDPGPAHPATQGEIWPKPQKETTSSNYFNLVPSQLIIETTGKTCQILEKAIQRYQHIILELYRLVQPQLHNPSRTGTPELSLAYGDSKTVETLTKLKIELSEPCEEYPHSDMLESYDLVVLSEATITSSSIWGILRGLESFSQLIYVNDEYTELRINETSISDFPRYAHRGVLLDTSRHFISMSNILTFIDALAYNKMNVFHWHIVDDHSFPYQSIQFPELSARGAYHVRAQYSQDDVSRIIKHARDRGVRVIPEFDMPGHTRSWGQAYPALLTECYSEDKRVVGLGPMDPTNNQTFKFIRDLLGEVSRVFPDKYLHIGGDEVDYGCWQSNPNIRQYMKDHNIESVSQMQSLFMSNVLPQLGPETSPVVWQEVVDDGVQLPQGTLVQIWKSSNPTVIRHILKSGYRVLFSACWYLDHLNSGGDWQKYYDCDPRQIIFNDALGANIIGGEACMWSEVVDNNNVISRTWPRASAVAEKLWSAHAAYSEKVARRLEEHTCRMNRRGVGAQPASGPGHCVTVSL